MLHEKLHENVDGDLVYGDLRKIFDTIHSHLLENAISAEISYRIKDPCSTLKKMIRKSINVQQLVDIVAFRIIVAEEDDCYKALNVVGNVCTTIPEKFKDFIIEPKSNGYQSLHSVIVVGLRDIELQIRSKQMHYTAEVGEASHREYKNEQEEKIKNLFDTTASKLATDKAYCILEKFNWTADDLAAYEQEIGSIWCYLQASLLSIQQ